MATLRKIFCLLAMLFIGGASLRAASPAENRAFNSALRSFDDNMWSRAETEFAVLLERFPKAERRAEAVLYQAVARFHQQNAAGAINLLAGNSEGAATLADEYQFWMAEARFQLGDFTKAAEAYRELLQRFSTSRRRTASLLGEAAAYARLLDWARVKALLAGPDSEFGRTVQSAPMDTNVVSGLLLLAEAQWEGKDPAAVAATLAPLDGRRWGDVLDLRAARLRCLAQLALGRLPEALAASSNLVALAATAAQNRTSLVAESVALQAEVFERLGQRSEALMVFRQNLRPGVSEDRQRQALLKTTELALADNKLNEASNDLVGFLAQSNLPPRVVAEASLSLGEILLRQAAGLSRTNLAVGPPESTNQIAAALELFDRVVTLLTDAPIAGRAQAGRGWCFWLRGQMSESAAAFEQAAAMLGEEEAGVVARLKQGDALFAVTNHVRALPAYELAAAGLARWPRLQAAVGADLQHQILRTSLELTNTTAASAAMEQLLKAQPRGELMDQSLFLLVQGLAEGPRPELARSEYERFISQVPDFTLRAEVELILGRARERAGDWGSAVAWYEQWLQRFPTNSLRSQVEFQLAWANSQAGLATNALQQFAAFSQSYPTNELAPEAQWWVADWFFNERDFPKAEENYKVLFLKWPQAALAGEARLMAGRAALEGLRYQDAIGHFTNLTGDASCPTNLRVRALFAYGSALMSQRPASTNQLANYEEAIRVFDSIQQSYPADDLAVLAAVEKARCWMQFPEARSSNAWTAFTQVITNTNANLIARCEAQVGRGQLLELMARTASGLEQTNLLRRALDDYLDIVYEKNLLLESEARDPFWVNVAGLAALPLLEALGEIVPAEQLCATLQKLLPPLRAAYQRKAELLRERRLAEKGGTGS